VGISFGVDRIYDVMEELNVFPESIQKGTTALFFHTGDAEMLHILPLAEQLRSQGIATEIYHEGVKFDKQFKYAERKGIPQVIILGSKEIENGTALVKDLASGQQREIRQHELVKELAS
jgi:histidyl-tRNA synthetase